MDLSELIFVELGEQNLDIELFDCGRDDINDFFRNDARKYQDELFGKTYFFCLPDQPERVVAAFTVANASIFTKHLPNSRRKKIGYEVHHEKGLVNYPAVLLGRLGVDKEFRGNHIGAQIIEFVAGWFSSDESFSGCRHLIVDAYNERELIEFYQKCGMELFFSMEEQELAYRNWDVEKDGPLQTRLMFRDLILLRRPSLR